MLTAAQETTLAAAIKANADCAAWLPTRIDSEIAAYYNGASTFVVWRSSIPVEEYREAIVWTEVDALTTGSKYRIWEWMTGDFTLPIEPSKANVRAGLADCWASNTTTRANLLAIAKRNATKAERLFVTGTGTTATPGTLGWEGTLSVDDVSRALNNNP
jgi:hypothetical protein